MLKGIGRLLKRGLRRAIRHFSIFLYDCTGSTLGDILEDISDTIAYFY